MRVIILTGGALDLSFARSYINRWKPDKIIVADRGLSYAHEMGIKPDVILGDFDSCDEKVYGSYSKEDKKIFPCEKDDTDTSLAVSEAIGLGACEIAILGATGTRLDHVLGNVGQVVEGFRQGVKVSIIDPYNRITMVDKEQDITKKEVYGDYISLIPVGEVTGVTLQGFKYPLTNHTLVFHQSLGISNELLEEVGHISYENGYLIMIESKDNI